MRETYKIEFENEDGEKCEMLADENQLNAKLNECANLSGDHKHIKVVLVEEKE